MLSESLTISRWPCNGQALTACARAVAVLPTVAAEGNIVIYSTSSFSFLNSVRSIASIVRFHHFAFLLVPLT